MKSLLDLYKEHQGKVSDKWSIYLSEYDRLFSAYRDKPVRMLEIGIQNGGSLEIWSKYFTHAQVLVGCDINPECAKLIYDDSRIKVVVGDANHDATQANILRHSPCFDLIIDDGSHTSGDIVKSFARYFRTLNEGGIYIAEDLHCSYWQEFSGGLFFPYSSISFFKRLADVINQEHWGVEKAAKDLLKGFSENYSTDFDESDLAEIHSVEFFNSVCVIHKRKPGSNVLGERFIAGQVESVVPGHHGLSGRSAICLVQPNNPWAIMTSAPDEDWENQSKMVYECDSQIVGLNQSLAERDSQIVGLNQSLAERDRLIVSLNQLLSERDSQVDRLTQEVNALRSSTCWRISATLRMAMRQFKRVRRVSELATRTIRHGGGFKNTFKKVIQLYRLEGLAGLKHGFRVVAIRAQTNQTENGGEYDRNDYAEWIRRYDTIGDESRVAMRTHIDEFCDKPLISVVIPTYNPNPEWLVAAIESVRQQIYPHWELCIADDTSTNTEIRTILERYVRDDKRIKVVFREQNGHISAASNSALELVTGDWVALLDHDDILPEHALF